MKIAVLIYRLNTIAGIAKHALYVARELVAMGHQVTVWAVEYDKDQCYPELTKGLDITALRPVHPQTYDIHRPPGIRMLAYLWELWKSYQDQHRLCLAMPGGYDVVNAHGNTISWAAAEYKRRHETPVVWMCNDFWPVGNHRNNEVVSDAWKRIKHIARESLCLPFYRYDQEAVREIDEIAVLSERVKFQMMEHYGVNSIVVRTGVDSLRFVRGDGQRIRARYLVCNSKFVLLTVCALRSRRRLEDVVRAVRILVEEGLDVVYLVVGRTSLSPAYTQFVQAEVAACDLGDYVKFVGEVSEEELVACYHACDAFVWAADENQSWGMAGMEAMAAGKPIIVSRANGLAEALEDGKTALLVPPRSPEAIADAVKRLMGDPSLANSVANQGQRLVLESYSWRKNAETMLDLLHEAIGKQ